jgi:dTMP kinase
MNRGLFITFEGGEGAGKTTLIEQVSNALSLQGLPILKTREPGGTKLGESVRNLLLHHRDPVSPYAELSLFLASRAQIIEEVIHPALHSGTTVLCDRFNDSTIAYQGGARGLGMEMVELFCQFVSQQLVPDLTLYLDIDPELGLMRAKRHRSQDRIEAEHISFHKKIRESYLAIRKKHPKRFHLIDASKPAIEVYEAAMALIRPKLSSG